MIKSKTIRGRATTVYRGEYFYANERGAGSSKRAPKRQLGVLKDASPDIGGSHKVELLKRIQQDPGNYIGVPIAAVEISLQR